MKKLVHSYWKAAYYTRFSLMLGAVLVFLGALPWWYPTPTITAAFVQTSANRSGTLAFIALLASALLVMTFRTTLFNAAHRFDDNAVARFAEPFSPLWDFLRRFSWLGFGAPVIVSSLVLTSAEFPEQAIGHWWYALLGGILAALLIFGLARIHQFIVPLEAQDARLFPIDFASLYRGGESRSAARNASLGLAGWIGRTFSRLSFHEGYVKHEKTREGHELLIPTVGHVPLGLFTATLFFFNFLVVMSGPWLFENRVWLPTDEGPFGMLFFLIGLLMVGIGVFPGVAFFLDRGRIPTATVFLVLAVAASIFGAMFPGLIVDHEYEAAPTPRYTATVDAVPSEDVILANDFLDSPISVEEVVEGWRKRQLTLAAAGEEPNQTFVIVTAAGGGIQASGWTSTVLGGIALDSEVRELIGGIGVISSVSGGSVGSLYFLTRYPELVAAIHRGNNSEISSIAEDAIHQSTRSSLEAVGFGLLYPDAWRLLGVIRDPTYDRGWVQEQVWASRMNVSAAKEATASSLRSDWRLGHLAYRVKEGTLPAVVFNSFSITTGNRVWIAPFRIRQDDESRGPQEHIEFVAGLGMQLRLATAARLSASFPYVSPTAIAQQPGPGSPDRVKHTQLVLKNSHLGDGGYTDNEGLLTALKLVERLDQYHTDHADDCPFDKIVLLRIAPFPMPDHVTETDVIPVRRVLPHIQRFAGPALGLYNGRTITQLERGEIELASVQNFFDFRNKTNRELQSIRSKPSSRSVEVELKRLGAQLKRTPFAQQWSEVNESELPDSSDDQDITPTLSFASAMIDFRLIKDGKSVEPPLSWKLNEQQKKDLELAWMNWRADRKLKDMIGETPTAPPRNERKNVLDLRDKIRQTR